MGVLKEYSNLQEKIYTETLDNGLKVSICLKKGFKKFCVLFGTNLGSLVKKFKTDDGSVYDLPLGVAHFLEHKMFAMKDDSDAANEFSKYGLDVNAYTDYTQTVYLFSGTNNIEKGIELLLDFVQEPHFTDSNVETEKGIICQELKMYLDNPNTQIYNGLMNNLYKDFGYKYDVGGTIEEVERTTKEDLYLCYNNYYHPSMMEFLIVGDVDYNEMINLIKNNQSKKTFPKFTNPVMLVEEEDINPYVKSSVREMDVALPKVALGFKLPFHKLDKNELLLMELGYKTILEYYFGDQTKFYKNLISNDIISGGFEDGVYLNNYCGYIMFKSDSKDPELFINAIKKRIDSMKNSSISNSFLKRMKKSFIGTMITALNSIEYVGYNYIDFNQKNCDIFDVLSIIDMLELDYLNKLKKNFDKKILTTFIIKPKK